MPRATRPSGSGPREQEALPARDAEVEQRAQRLRVGVPVRQTLTIVNAGCMPANYRLSAQIKGDRRFAGHLLVVATRRGDGATLFSGPATALHSVALGRFNEHARETLRLQVTLTGGDGNDNALQGRRASVAFDWTATQA